MKIAYLCFDSGIPVRGDKGASVHVREMIGALHRAGHEVTLVCAKLGAGNPLPPSIAIELAPFGRDVHAKGDAERVERARIAYDNDLPSRVAMTLREANIVPDAIYERFTLFSRAGVEIAANLRVPRLLEVNAPLVEEQASYRDLRLRDEAIAYQRATLFGADRIVAVSDAVAAYVIECGVSPARVEVLRNGVDLDRFYPGIAAIDVRERFGLAGRPVIGFVGSLKPWHGMSEFIDAFVGIRERVAGAALLVVGDGPGLATLRERIAERGLAADAIVTGRVPHDDVPSYLCAMDVTVAPYRSSAGFYFSPLKVVESLACGSPVVAPALGQLTSLVQDGVTGRLYAPDDAAALIAAVASVLGDEERRRAMGAAAAAFARSECSWDANARRIERMLGDAARRAPLPAGLAAVR